MLSSLIFLPSELIDVVMGCWPVVVWGNFGFGREYTTLFVSILSWAVAFQKNNWQVIWFCWQAMDFVRLFISSIRHKHCSHVILEIFIYRLPLDVKFSAQLAFWIWFNWIIPSVFTIKRINMMAYIFDERKRKCKCKYLSFSLQMSFRKKTSVIKSVS